ncbi:hypothetical protein N8085_01925 [Salibacteraceae bacterium]|nr:hypothetical protein [Salibacteraceae bacterium]
MKNLFLLVLIGVLFIGCSGTNGDDAPSQDALQKDLKTIMEPKTQNDIVLKPDTVLRDSTLVDTLLSNQ